MVAGFAGRRTIARGHSGKKAEDKGGENSDRGQQGGREGGCSLISLPLMG